MYKYTRVRGSNCLANMDSEVWKNLPEDFWIPILNAVDDYRYLEYLSLVSRRFLFVTNYVRRSLTITDEVIPFLPKLLCRFPNIDEINIPYPDFDDGDLDDVLLQISASSIVLRSIRLPKSNYLPTEGLRHLGSKMGSSLRILKCSRMWDFENHDLVTIANTFPFLEELDISGVSSSRHSEECLSDAGIHHMSLHLKELRKISLSGINSLTDQSIISLSSNCLLLEELRILACKITLKGIGIALRDCRHLNSISATLPSTEEDFSKSDKDFFSKSLAYATNLRQLNLDFQDAPSSIADAFLTDLAEANLPLEKLKIRTLHATYKGFSNLLHKYRSLVSLDVERSCFSDQNVADISKFLKNIRYINLSCFNLTSSAFFTIIKSCPFVSNITMESTYVGGIRKFDQTYFAVNHRVKVLTFDVNYDICDEFLKKIAFTCPNLEKLNIARCRNRGMTVEGINTILRNCHEIKHMDISYCGSITEFNIDIQLPNLQVLIAENLDFDDKALEIIGERCTGLLYLDLKDCHNVRGNGVMQVAKKCQKLLEINLGGCKGIHSDTIVSLVSLGSSLRIVPPQLYYF